MEMQKALVETTGSFQLLDFNHKRQIADALRPSVVELSPFMQQRVSLGQLRVLGTVTDEATDDEFVNYWTESEDATLAVDSFIASFTDAKPTEKVSKTNKPVAAAEKKTKGKDAS